MNAVTVTHLTAVSAALAWMVAEWKHRGKPTVLGIASGAVTAWPVNGRSWLHQPVGQCCVGNGRRNLLIYGNCLEGKIGYDDTLDDGNARRRRHARHVGGRIVRSTRTPGDVNPAGGHRRLFFSRQLRHFETHRRSHGLTRQSRRRGDRSRPDPTQRARLFVMLTMSFNTVFGHVRYTPTPSRGHQ